MRKFGIIGVFIMYHFYGKTSGQLPQTGNCPLRTPLQSIDARKLSGMWYEQQRTPSLVEWPFKCISFKVQPFYEHKSSVKVTSIHRLNGNLERESIPLLSLDPEERNGKLVATISPKEKNWIYGGIKLPLQLLALGNGTSWSVIWSCRSFPNSKIHTENVWVLTRERDMDAETEIEIEEALVSLNLEHLLMRESMQAECALEDENNKDK